MKEMRFSVAIGSSEKQIVRVDDFRIPQNRITFLLGESGIGKSLVSKAIYGLLDPQELGITINRRPYQAYLDLNWSKSVRTNSFFVFQEPSSHLNPLRKIQTQLREGSLREAANENEILEKLYRMPAEHTARRILEVYPKPYRPSGGEKQRVLLAMAFKKISTLANGVGLDEPTMFVFDEPTGSLDDNYRNLFLQMLFEQYRKRPFTILLITHDYSIISEVYRGHRDLLEEVRFRELVREKAEHVSLRDFSPDRYLNWLRNTAPAPARVDNEKTVLQVNRAFKVFGRKMGVFRDVEHSHPTNLVIRQGEMAYLKAPSGIGKTTLAKIVMGLLQPDSIEMELSGIPLTADTPTSLWRSKIWGRKAGMVFQHADESLNLQASIKETFTGLRHLRRLTTEDITKLLGRLFDIEINSDFLKRPVARLSGGQKQRLNLLRTLALETDLVILDEPLNGLDFDSVTKVLGMLDEKREQGVALLMISHNEEIFDHIVPRQSVFHLHALEDDHRTDSSIRRRA